MLTTIMVGPGRAEVHEIGDLLPAPGELALRVRSALACARDLRLWREGQGEAMGREFSGQVARVGRGVEGFREGDAVMAVPSAPCGECRECSRDREHLCEGVDPDRVGGGFAQEVLIPVAAVRRGVFTTPPGLSFTEAAFLDPLARVVHALEGTPIEERDTVHILGAGAMGLLFLQVALASGPRRVVVAGRGPDRLALARALGAEATVDLASESAPEFVRRLTQGHGAEVVVECACRPETWRASVDAACRGSHVLLFGGCPHGADIDYDTTRLHYDQITLRGTRGLTSRSLLAARDLLAGGRVRTRPLVGGSAGLRDLASVFEKLERGPGLKYEILPEES